MKWALNNFTAWARQGVCSSSKIQYWPTYSNPLTVQLTVLLCRGNPYDQWKEIPPFVNLPAAIVTHHENVTVIKLPE